MKPRRSVLYIPSINERAMLKAQTLAADVLIFDLEDAVAPAQKAAARDTLARVLGNTDYGSREKVVRINGVDTQWFNDDIKCLHSLPIDGVAIPKVESADTIDQLVAALSNGVHAGLAIWPMIETPLGVYSARAIAAAHDNVSCLVMGTSDLAKDLMVPPTIDRLGLLYSLSQCVLAARAHRLDIVDGVCLDLQDETVLTAQTLQGKALGFNGKTLIHPKQLVLANKTFGVDPQEAEQAGEIIKAWRQAEQQGSGVVVVDGKLVESLHVEAAQNVLALAVAIAERGY